MELFLIDAIGPFFRTLPQQRINWSKIPFHHLESDGGLHRVLFHQIRRDFARFADTVQAIGYNAVTLDDLAHLIDHPAYPDDVRRKIAAYRTEYQALFDQARSRGLKIFITSDVLFYHPALRSQIGGSPTRAIRFLADALDRLFEECPAIAGVIFRIGESDAVDVEGDFHSRLLIRTPGQARRFLQQLLPLFERRGRTLIFRTWSVGAYRIGDLMWNHDTFGRIFDPIDSPALVISMKPGESDFYRFLPLNDHFFRSPHRKIIELQARREYEGFGEYPSFIGTDYEAYRDRLRAAPGVIGIQVWCQTGGWTAFRRLTFIDRSSVWNEINTYVCLRLFRHGGSAADAVREFAAWKGYPPERSEALLDLLRESDAVVKELLYLDEIARLRMFFRRLRLPPLLSVFWDHILIGQPMKHFLNCFVQDGARLVRQGYAALGRVEGMMARARSLGLPADDLRFQRDTFEILAVAREYYFGTEDPQVEQRLLDLRERYRERYRHRYSIHLDFRPIRFRRHHVRLILRVCFRDQREYRLVDRMIILRLLGFFRLLLRLVPHQRVLPEFADETAMGVKAVFK